MIEAWTIVRHGLSVLNALFSVAIWHWQNARERSRGQTFFAVRVEPGFAETGVGQAIVKEFRRRLWWWSLAGAAACVLIPPELAAATGFMIAMLAGALAYALANRRTRREAAAAAEPTVRVASLAADDGPETLWLGVVDWLAMLVPPVAPAATLLFLALHGHHVPLPVFVGLMAGLMCLTNQWALRYRARSSDWAPTPGASRKYRTYLGAQTAFVLTFVTLQFCAHALTRFNGSGTWLRDLNVFSDSLWSLPAWALALVFAWRMRSWLTKHVATESSDPMPDACWKWGRIYFNPSDPALVVPRRTGLAQAYNWARPWVWVAGGAYTVVTIAVFVRLAGMAMLIDRQWPK
jgi:hypothetical protein